ncbi:MAG: DNA-binding protein [Clostridia bacterium]|nr:DNA-binding protein [Clostridia bacterium]
MEYCRFGDKLLVRIDRGEEIISNLMEVVKKENISLASVSALGAVGYFKVGVYSVEEKKYYSNEFRGEYEITSLYGTVTTMNDLPYIHLHFSAGDKSGVVYGGHLNEAVVCATCEMVIDVINGKIDRFKDEEVTGLNLFKF